VRGLSQGIGRERITDRIEAVSLNNEPQPRLIIFGAAKTPDRIKKIFFRGGLFSKKIGSSTTQRKPLEKHCTNSSMEGVS